MPAVYAGLSEDDRFMGKLLTAQNVMVNIQTNLTRLIQDYIQIKKKDQKRREKTRQNPGSNGGGSNNGQYHQKIRENAMTTTPQKQITKQSNSSVSGSAANKRKKQSLPRSKQPVAKKAKPNTPAKQNQRPAPINHQTPTAAVPPMMTSTPIVQGNLDFPQLVEKHFYFIFCRFLNPNNLLYMRNLQEQVKKHSVAKNSSDLSLFV